MIRVLKLLRSYFSTPNGEFTCKTMLPFRVILVQRPA